MKKIIPGFLVALVLLTGANEFALADGTNINLTVKNDGDVVYSGSVILLPAGTISINDSSGNPHDANADSVLSIVNTADASSEEFNISNLIYYDMFGAFYLKCINVSSSPLCDNWQYKVNGDSPSVGMDSKILSGGENVVLYFGDENKIPEPEIEIPPAHISSGSSGRVISDTVLPVSPAPTPAPAPTPTPTPTPTNPASVEEKPIIISTNTEAPKRILAKQKIKPAVIDTPVPAPIQPVTEKTETPKKNWFVRFWESVFSIF
ncbi:MAG: DUF4430 domain-containing protein [Candidatus Paceibacterota bacterium]|jgi:hypothetical protein